MSRSLSILPQVDKEDVVGKLPVSHAKLAIRAMQRIAAQGITCEDVEPLRMAEGVYRWKPSAALRHQCDAEIRVTFTLTDDQLTVVAVGDRASVYQRTKRRLSSLVK